MSWLQTSVIPSRVEDDSSLGASLGPQTQDLEAPSLNEVASQTDRSSSRCAWGPWWEEHEG